MSENLCPACGEPLPLDAINLSEGVALCPSCGQLSRLAEVASRKRPIAEILREPPSGCSVDEWGQRVVVRATLRSIMGFLGTIAFALFWNAIVSVFVLVALAGLYTNLIGPLPPWFPAPDMEDSMSLGMTVFLCIFLIPFVTVGAWMMGAALLNIGGKIEVHIGQNDAVVRTGIGFLAWRQRFDPTRVRLVRLGKAASKTDDDPSDVIVIEADRTIKCGSLLQDERREWLQVILHALLSQAKSNRRREILSMAVQSTRQIR